MQSREVAPQVRKWGLLKCFSGVVLGEECTNNSSSLTQLWKAVLKKGRKEGKRGGEKKGRRKIGKRERKRGRGKINP